MDQRLVTKTIALFDEWGWYLMPSKEQPDEKGTCFGARRLLFQSTTENSRIHGLNDLDALFSNPLTAACAIQTYRRCTSRLRIAREVISLLLFALPSRCWSGLNHYPHRHAYDCSVHLHRKKKTAQQTYFITFENPKLFKT